MKKSLEFIVVIKGCGLIDLGFARQTFTRSNKRDMVHRIWKRLDRGMANDKWLEVIPQTTVTHLSSVGADNCPLLLEMSTRSDYVIRKLKN